MSIPDYNDAFARYDADCEREERNWLARLPECAECGKPIKDEECYELGGELYCADCIDSHKVKTDNYMRG